MPRLRADDDPVADRALLDAGAEQLDGSGRLHAGCVRHGGAQPYRPLRERTSAKFTRSPRPAPGPPPDRASGREQCECAARRARRAVEDDRPHPASHATEFGVVAPSSGPRALGPRPGPSILLRRTSFRPCFPTETTAPRDQCALVIPARASLDVPGWLAPVAHLLLHRRSSWRYGHRHIMESTLPFATLPVTPRDRASRRIPRRSPPPRAAP